MNEQGKSVFSSVSVVLFFMLLSISFLPYSDLLSSEKLSEFFRSEAFAEQLLIFISCVSFFATIILISYVGAALITFVMHLVQRLYFLHKLRKPMMIYTGTSNISQQDDCMNKTKKDDIETYFLFAFCVLAIIFIIFAEW